MAVCAQHLRAALFRDYSDLQQHHFFSQGFYLLTGLGHQAVIVFFVLSGFLVGGSVIKKGYSLSFSIYIFQRLTRLWTVLIPSLLFTAITDVLVGCWAPGILRGDYLAIWSSGPSFESYSNSIETFFGNLFFLQNIIVPVFGVNSPLWSLANEFWYYLLFPLVFVAASSGFGRTGRVVAAISSCSLLLILPRAVSLYFSIWSLGAVSFFLSVRLEVLSHNFKPLLKRLLALASFFVCILSLLLCKKTFYPSPFASDFLVGASFAILICLLSGLRPIKISLFPRSINSRVARYVQYLSESSFSLYVYHFPLILLLVSLFPRKAPELALGFSSVAIFFLLMIIIYLLVHVLYLISEAKTVEVRKRMLGIL